MSCTVGCFHDRYDILEVSPEPFENLHTIHVAMSIVMETQYVHAPHKYVTINTLTRHHTQ